MNGRRWLLLLSFALLLAAVFGLRRLARGPAGIVALPVDPESVIGRHLAGASYSDAYRGVAPLGRFDDIDAVIEAAFQRGELLEMTGSEVLFRGRAPGLVFYVSYRLVATADDSSAVEMATVVHYEHWTGRLYFFFVRPVHRFGLPWMLRRMLGPAP